MIMMKLDEYFTAEKIIKYLCRIRAKHAKQRSKKHSIHVLTENEGFNYHINIDKNKEKISAQEKQLNQILPSRRKWKKLNKKNRYNKNSQKINSVEYNALSLRITINYYKKNHPKEPFLLKLNDFISEIKNAINNPHYKIAPPAIYPKLKGVKKKKNNECRPISLYSLKDKIIISLINKYFTKIFDDYFYKFSFAFRATKRIEDRIINPSHHDAIQVILNYKKLYKGKHLWVSECDIRKFYDSVNHTIIKKHFKKLINKVNKNTPDLYDERAERIFYSYLDSYTFVKNVLPKNDDPEYWEGEERSIPDGRFKWVDDDLLKLNHYRDIKNAKIGIPQGGAISGLIANIVLGYADNLVMKSKISKLLYIRFCDDMIMIHPFKRECLKAMNIYDNALIKLKLIPHDFSKNLQNTSDSFWSKDVKSKSPYKWSSDFINTFPWFGFVGYEIHYDGLLRIRKSSLKKEIDKQTEVVNNILSAVRKGRRKSDPYILNSAINRLIGMSVGRLELWNFDKTDNEMCWVNGFSKLSDNDNKYLRIQLKLLDRNRNKMVAILKREIEKIEFAPIKNSGDEEPPTKSPKFDFYGKPFSYYYQVIEKGNDLM